MEEIQTDGKGNVIPQKVKFDYIKSNFFRVIHADGVWGGITPHLDIQIGFFSERTPIPQQAVYAVKNGVLDEEIKDERISRDSIVREIEALVTLDLDTAKSLFDWLAEKIKNVENYKKENSTKSKNKKGKKKF